MESPELSPPTSSFLSWAAVGAIFLLALGLRVYMARGVAEPLDSDSFDYLIVARNLAQGRGFVEDVVWNFRTLPSAVTHPSHDYWMPLTSILTALSLLIFGDSFSAAQLPNLLLGAAMPAAGAAIARELGASRGWSFAAGILLAASQRLVFYSMDTDSVMSYSVFGGLAFLGVVRGCKGRPGWFFPAGLAAGLCHLSRNDGALWALTMIAVFLLGRRDAAGPRPAFKHWLLAAGGYLLVMGPWMIRNLAVFGAAFPPTSAKALLCQNYMDLYAFAKDLSWRAYLAQGTTAVLQRKAAALGSILDIFSRRSVLHPALAPFAGLGLLTAALPGRRVLLVQLSLVILFWSLLMDAFLGPFGGPLRTAMGLCVFLVPAAMRGFDWLDEKLRRLLPHPAWVPPVLILFLAGAWSIADPREFNRNARIKDFSRRDWAYFQKLGRTLKKTGKARPTVMTFRPWQLNLAADLPTVSVPSDGLTAVLAACRKYRVDYFILAQDRKYEKTEYQEVVGYLENILRQYLAHGPGPDWPLVPERKMDNNWVFRVAPPGSKENLEKIPKP